MVGPCEAGGHAEVIRWLRERDASRDSGDKLAKVVRLHLEGKASRFQLWAALTAYRRHEMRELAPDERRRERAG